MIFLLNFVIFRFQRSIFQGGGFNYFVFSTLPGEMIKFDEHIFQMGWFNHQLVFQGVNFSEVFPLLPGHLWHPRRPDCRPHPSRRHGDDSDEFPPKKKRQGYLFFRPPVTTLPGNIRELTFQNTFESMIFPFFNRWDDMLVSWRVGTFIDSWG